jgi:FAD/FMN-containing dehydrogenase
MAPNLNRRGFLKSGAASAGVLAALPSLGGTHALAQTPVPVESGQTITPDDLRYETLVRGFNLRWVGQPAYVAVCPDTDRVIQAVQQALDDGRRITVRGGGHCYEDFVSNNDGGVIIDLSPINAVSRDDATGLYAVGGGATLWDVYTQLFREYGVTIPAGSCYSVGAGGHVTGGGYGLLSRLHGLTVDYLHAVEVVHVTADRRAEVVTVSRDAADPAEQDLIWAHLGGGGGNFGIVTKFFFRDLPAAPSEAHLFTHAWDWSDLDRATFGKLVTNFGTFFEANSAEDSPYKGLFALLHLGQKAAGEVQVTAQYVGPDPSLLKTFAAALEDGLPAPKAPSVSLGMHQPAKTSDFQQLPWLFATQTLNGSGPNRRGKYKSAYMLTAFPEDQIDVMWEQLSNPSHPNPAALLQVDSYGCQVNAVDSAATAVAQRSSIMKLQYQTYWTDPADDDANVDWLRSFYTAMYGDSGPVPNETVDGCYVNYPDVDLENWQELYYKDNYPRLQQVKRHWDPNNIFHHRQSIQP